MICSYLGDHQSVDPGQYITVVPYTAYPWSRGSIHITGYKPNDDVDFDCGFLSDPKDVTALMFAYKKTRELMRRTDMYRGEVISGHPRFPPDSKAACITLADEGLKMDQVENLEYSDEDNKALEKWIREGVSSTWHSLGTNKMAPREEMGVVDRSLNVYGVHGLKVVDLSIAPENVGANTHNVSFIDHRYNHPLDHILTNPFTLDSSCHWRERGGYHY